MSRRLSLALALSAVAGCANYSQLQDAETLPRGEQRIGVGVSFTRYETTAEDDQGNEVTESVSVPAIVVSARRGLTEKLEAQATAWLPLGARAGVKYQLLGDAGQVGPHLSIGGHVGYLSITASSGDEEATVNLLDFYLPLYVGYRVSAGFEVYAAPQYMLRSSFGSGDGDIGHVGGATLGLAFGSGSKFYLEGGSFYDTLVDAPIINTALGVSL